MASAYDQRRGISYIEAVELCKLLDAQQNVPETDRSVIVVDVRDED